MKKLNYTELYKPYAGQVDLEGTIGWVLKECAKKSIHQDLGRKAINLIFLDMADGKTFPTDGGDTDFKGVPHAVMNKAIMAKAISLHNRSVKAFLASTEGEVQARIELHLRRSSNKEYWKHLKQNSPVVRLIIKLINLTAKGDKEWILSL